MTHPIIHLPLAPTQPAGETRDWTVVGQLCTPKDVLSRDQRLTDVNIGDLLVLPLAGAYGYNISHADFLCHPRPAQYFITDAGVITADGTIVDITGAVDRVD
ncbi:hypothetical protein [Dickeya ananatis]|uniref:hypothetical protein n=1 Tax=Dickeya ananatis TaxID=3061286 RepID=UPI00388E60D6